MNAREAKALDLAARVKITFTNGLWTVPSQTVSGKRYNVLLGEAVFCSCEDFTIQQKPCKHILAARIVQGRESDPSAPAIVTVPIPKRPTYQQDWPAYNLAQSTEKHRFQELLYDLCQGVEELPLPKTGRRPHTTRDSLFAMAYKVYSTVSSRRFTCDLHDAHRAEYLSAIIPGVKVCAFFENEAFTPILERLIRQSALPLRSVETSFAPDSSGFSTSRFVKWFDEKYGVERSGHDWVKAHIMCGVRTNIVTAVEIHERNTNDSPLLPSLLQSTVDGGFDVKEVPADKGYSSVENIEAIHAAGAVPYIAFKSNATGGSGGLWEKAYHFYSLNRDEFLKRYHLRSNVESTFSMVKAKFCDHVRSKGDVAMKNEVLCKFLCHNICCLIQSQCELGIEPTFWRDGTQEGDSPHILTMNRIG